MSTEVPSGLTPIVIARDIPAIVGELVPDLAEQTKITLEKAVAFRLRTTDGSDVTFRRRIGTGKYRFHYDPDQTTIVKQGSCKRADVDMGFPTPRLGDKRYEIVESLTCRENNEVELITSEILYFPDGTEWYWRDK